MFADKESRDHFLLFTASFYAAEQGKGFCRRSKVGLSENFYPALFPWPFPLMNRGIRQY